MHPYLNIAIQATRDAGRIIMRASGRLDRIEVGTKSSPSDLVTSIDKAAEACIINAIRTAYPEHGILAEESGESQGTSLGDVVWIIDPLDGTLNFVHSVPYFCISIGIQVKGVMQHGVIYNPITNELFVASKGEGAQLDGKKIRVSTCRNLDSAVVSAGFAYKRAGEPKEKSLERISTIMDRAAGIRRGGACALELAHIAAGRLDGMWELGLGPWDMAAGALLVREAGGFVSDFKGGEDYLQSGKIIAGSPKVYPELLKIIEK